jgi:hypothetical protein
MQSLVFEPQPKTGSVETMSFHERPTNIVFRFQAISQHAAAATFSHRSHARIVAIENRDPVCRKRVDELSLGFSDRLNRPHSFEMDRVDIGDYSHLRLRNFGKERKLPLSVSAAHFQHRDLCPGFDFKQ